ncbi:MAG: hypothetical protein MHM6MM_002992 [Cercozoa sp. M6MM]
MNKNRDGAKNDTPPPHRRPRTEALFWAGLGSGLVVAGSLNPWDRALYLSVRDRRAFLDRRNWQQPYRGFSQALLSRALSNGMYFPVFDATLPLCESLTGSGTAMTSFLAGNAAGAANAVVLNPLSAVKYRYWGTQHGSLVHTARHMAKHGGITPFMRGLAPTLTRDCVFGAAFALMRHHCYRRLNLDETNSLSVQSQSQTPQTFERVLAQARPLTITAVSLCACLCACVHVWMLVCAYNFVLSFGQACAAAATALSAPFNFARNMQYAIHPRVRSCLCRLPAGRFSCASGRDHKHFAHAVRSHARDTRITAAASLLAEETTDRMVGSPCPGSQ